jgi:hypothetical protein
MINISEKILYEMIYNNLEYLLDENLEKTFNNIKNATIYISLYYSNNYMNLVSENIFSDYFKDQESSTIGRLIQASLVTTDIAVGTATSSVGVSSYLITTFTNIFGSSILANIGIGAISAFGPLLLIIIIFAIYKKINKSETLNVLNMIRYLNSLSNLLKVPIDSRVNSEFKNLLKNKCNVINEKNLRSECAINGYSKFLNEFVLSKLVTKYIEYLQHNNEDLSEIRSFNELARFTSQSNREVSILMNKFYSSYIRFLSGLNVNKSIIGDNFRLLNNITQTALKR